MTFTKYTVQMFLCRVMIEAAFASKQSLSEGGGGQKTAKGQNDKIII